MIIYNQKQGKHITIKEENTMYEFVEAIAWGATEEDLLTLAGVTREELEDE